LRDAKSFVGLPKKTFWRDKKLRSCKRKKIVGTNIKRLFVAKICLFWATYPFCKRAEPR